jgi:hypothetical protein
MPISAVIGSNGFLLMGSVFTYFAQEAVMAFKTLPCTTALAGDHDMFI